LITQIIFGDEYVMWSSPLPCRLICQTTRRQIE
jgi:hypothetical protein